MAKTDLETLVVQLEASVVKYEKALKKASGDTDKTMKGLERRSKEAAARMDEAWSRAFSGLNQQAMSQAAGRAGLLGDALGSLGPKGLAAGAAIGVFTYALSGALRRIGETEMLMRRLEGVLRVTGNTTGMTAEQIDSYAEAIERTTGTAADEVRSAAAVLATYSTISGEAFRRTIAVANDMAAVFGGNLRENVDKVARALDDPINGFAALRKQGFSLTDQQLELVQSMLAVGNQAGALDVVLRSLEDQVGGSAGAGQGGLTGAFDGAVTAMENLIDKMGEASGVGGALTFILNRLARGADALSDTLDPSGIGDQVVALSRTRAELQRQLEEMTSPSGDFPPEMDSYYRRDIERLKQELANVEAEIDALVERGFTEVAEATALEANAEAARIDRINEGLAATGKELNKQFLQVETSAERVARLQQELADRVAQQRETVTNGGDMVLAEANIRKLEELYGRQIELEKERAAAAGKRGAGTNRDAARRDETLARLADEIALNEELIRRFGEGEAALARLRAQYEALAEAKRLNLEGEVLTSFLADRETVARQEELLALLREGQALADQLRTKEEERAAVIERLNLLRGAGAISEEVYQEALLRTSEIYQQQQQIADSIAGAFDRAFDRIGGAITQAFATGEISAIKFGDIAKAVIAEVLQDMLRLAVMNPLKQAFGNLLGMVLGSIFGGGGMTPLGAMGQTTGGGMFAGIYHKGGTAGRPKEGRHVPAAAFVGAPRYHRGGWAGFRPGEVPAILQEGERIVPRGEVMQPLAAQAGGRAAAPQPLVNFTIVNRVPDTQVQSDGQRGPRGEDWTVTFDKLQAQNIGQRGSESNKALAGMGLRNAIPRR